MDKEDALVAPGAEESLRVSRRSSVARWSVSHPVKVDKPPKKYLRPRMFHRFMPGKSYIPASDEHVLYLNDDEKNAHFPKNVFITSKYTALTFLFKNLYEQFSRVANRYFLLVTAFQLVPGVSPFPLYITVLPLMFILGVTMVKEGYEDYLRHRADYKVNSAKVLKLDNQTGKTVNVKSASLSVGDIIAVDRDTVCLADIVVLATEHTGQNAHSATCWVDTANLDGETRLKVRRAVPLQGFIDNLDEDEQPSTDQLITVRSVITSDPPNPYIEVFSGRMDSAVEGDDHAVQLSRENLILRGAILRNTKRVWGVIVGAGPLTKLRLNQQLPAYKFSHLERDLNKSIITVFVFQFLLCAVLASLQATSPEIMGTLSVNEDFETWFGFNWLGADEEPMSTGLAWFYSYMTWFILCSFFVPMSLYVIMEFGKLMGGLYIHWDSEMYSRDGLNRPAKPNTTSLVEELGEIQYVLSDKTGTLTDNEMRFTHCGTASGMYEVDFDGKAPKLCKMGKSGKRGSVVLPRASVADPALKKLVFIMAACNELEVEKEQEDGETIIDYSGESPDEVALAGSARDMGLMLEDRSPTKLTLRRADGSQQKYTILGVLPFNSSRKRMGIVLQENGSKTAHVLYKGADNIMFGLFEKDSGLDKLNSQVEAMSKLGLRTLVLAACKVNVESDVFQTFKTSYDAAQLAMEDRDDKIGDAFAVLEKSLEPVGCTGVEDKLSDGVEIALQNLVKAKIGVAVLTGDKTETAMSICTSCGLFKPGSRYHVLTDPIEAVMFDYMNRETQSEKAVSLRDKRDEERVQPSDDLEAQDDSVIRESLTDDEALVVSGECLQLCLDSHTLRPLLVKMMKRCYTTVCTRMTPKQKAMVTKLVRGEFGVVCLSIGDGANDVSMIREADVGVGIFGKEGSQAVNSADFAIHKFADLQRLLFVHGATSRLRIATAARSSLFANMAFNMPQVVFGYFSVWSGVSIIISNVLFFVNLAMTSPFLFSMVFFDRELLPEKLVQNPQLYNPFRSAFSLTDYLSEIALAWWHAAAAFAVTFLMSPVWVEDGVVAGMWAEGSLLGMILLNGIFLSFWLRFNVITAVHLVAAFAGTFVFWFATLGLPHIWSPTRTDNGFIMSYVGRSILFWLATLVGVVLSILPHFVAKSYRSIWHPSRQQLFAEAERAAAKEL